MINFACNKFDLNEIIKCGLGLTKADFRIMQFLLKHKDEEFTTEKIAKKLSINLTTAQRAVKKLHEKEVLSRSQANLEGGGYIYIYQAKGKNAIRKVVRELIHSWAENAEEVVENW